MIFGVGKKILVLVLSFGTLLVQAGVVYWSGEKILERSLRYSAQDTVIVEAGTKILFFPGKKLVIEGTLLVQGKAAYPVVFTQERFQDPERVSRLLLTGSGVSRMSHAVFDNTVELSLENGLLFADSCNFSHASPGRKLRVKNAVLSLSNSRIESSEDEGTAILLQKNGEAWLENTVISGFGKGVLIGDNATVSLDGVRVQNNRIGLLQWPGSELLIDQAKIHRNDFGLVTVGNMEVPPGISGNRRNYGVMVREALDKRTHYASPKEDDSPNDLSKLVSTPFRELYSILTSGILETGFGYSYIQRDSTGILEEYRQTAYPTRWRFRKGDQFSLLIAATPSTLEDPIRGQTISGMGDLHISSVWMFPELGLALNTGLHLPTGAEGSAPSQQKLFAVYFDEHLPLLQREQAGGLGWDLGLLKAGKLGKNWVWTMGTGWAQFGSYEMVGTSISLDPADIWQLGTGAEGKAFGGNLSLDLQGFWFTPERENERELRQQGPGISVAITQDWQMGKWNFRASSSGLFFAKSSYADSVSNKLIEENYRGEADRYALDLRLSHATGKSWKLLGGFSSKLRDSNLYPIFDKYHQWRLTILGIDAGVQFSWSQKVQAEILLGGYQGSEGAEWALFGGREVQALDLDFRLRWNY